MLVFAFQATRTALALRQARTEVSAGPSPGRPRRRGGCPAYVARAGRPRQHRARLLRRDPVGRRQRSCRSSGDDVEAVQVISSALDHLSQDALPVGLDLVADLRGAGSRATTADSTCELIQQPGSEGHQGRRVHGGGRRDLRPIDPDGLVLARSSKAAREVQDRVAQLDAGVQVGRLGHHGCCPTCSAATGPHLPAGGAEQRRDQVHRRPAGLAVAPACRRRQGAVRASGDPPPTSRPWPEPVLPLSPGELDIYGPTLGDGRPGHQPDPRLPAHRRAAQRDRRP